MVQGQDHSEKALQRAEKHLIRGKFDKALQIVEFVMREDGLLEKTHLQGKILKSKILTRKGDLKNGLKFAKGAVAESERLGEPLEEIDACIAMVEALEDLGKLDEGFKIIKQGENVLESLENEPPVLITQKKASLIHRKGRLYWRKGNLDQALMMHKQSLALREKIGIKHEIAHSLHNISILYGEKGEYNLAFQKYQDVLEIRKEIGNKIEIATTLNNIGVNYRRKGELERSLDYFRQSLALYEEMDNKDLISLSLGNIGEIYRWIGNLDEALDYVQRSMELSEETGSQGQRALSMGLMGLIYRQKGDFNLASTYLEESLALFEEIGSILSSAFVLFYLIFVNIDLASLEQAQDYLQHLQQINNKIKNPILNQGYNLANALVLKTSPRVKDKVRAQEIFQRISEEEALFFDFTFMALLNLCELLLDELKTYGEDAVFQEAQETLQKLSVLSQKEQSFSLVVEILILQARFAIVEGNLTAAVGFMSQASITAEEKGLGLLKEKVESERHRLDEEFDKSQKLIQSNASYQERLEQAKVADHLKYAMKLVSLSGK